jgi:ribosomal protein S14
MNLYCFKKFKLTLNKEVEKNIFKYFLSFKYSNLKSNKIIKLAYKNLYFYKYTSISFFRRACLATGGCRSVFRFFKLSRYTIRIYALSGIIGGLRKASF